MNNNLKDKEKKLLIELHKIEKLKKEHQQYVRKLQYRRNKIEKELDIIESELYNLKLL